MRIDFQPSLPALPLARNVNVGPHNRLSCMCDGRLAASQ
jgi:hypothetical protein